MSLGNDRVAGGDGGGEVASANTVEGEGKVVRAEDNDRPYRGEAGTDILFEVECCVAPRLFADSSCGLAKLVRGARKFDVFEPRRGGKSSLLGGGGDDGIGVGLDVIGVGLKEGGHLRGLNDPEFGGSFGGG